MRKLNNQGFTLVEGLLILVILILIGFVGFYVYNANKDEEKSDNVTSQPAAKEEPAEKKDERLVGDYSQLPFTFKYEKSWKAQVDPEYNTNDFFTVKITAPNTRTDGEAYPSVVEGAEISVYKDARNTPVSLEEYKKGEMSQFNTNIKDIQIDGVSAIEYDWSYEGPPKHFVRFIVNNIAYDVGIEKEVYQKSEYKQVFDDLVKSISFK